MKYEENYRKNLAALREAGCAICEKLSSIEGNERFDVFAASDPIDVNILDRQTHTAVYSFPVADTQKSLDDLMKKRLYPFLCFFGLGNGILFKALLKNERLKYIVVFEPEIEIIYIALHICDFSKEIEAKRLSITHTDGFNAKAAMDYAKNTNILVFLKLYNLELTTPYYSKYDDEINRVNNLMINAIIQTVKAHGNDLEDALIGIDNFLLNAEAMIDNYAFVELRDQKQTNLVVTVATGPSLTKQLPLLKEAQDFVTIISADASLPILEKWGIVPDIVTTLERVEMTAQFFEKTSGEFQQKVGCFAISALAHKKVIETVKGKRCLVLRPFGYMRAFELDDHGYAGIGLSAANMAYEIAYLLGYTNIALIGQDLSYSKDEKTTHASDHIFSDRDPSVIKNMETEERIILPAWGGGGEVRSNHIWVLFRNFFIQNIEDAKVRAITYNCTEGGCHIDGAIDRKFADVINEFADRSKTKNRLTMNLPSAETVLREKSQIAKIAEKMIALGTEAVKEIEPLQKSLLEITTEGEKLSREEQLEKLDFEKVKDVNDKLDLFKRYLEDDIFMKYFWDSLQAIVINQELNIAKITVSIPENDREQQEKRLDYLFAHRYWLFAVKGAIESQIKILEKHLSIWLKK